MAFSILGEEAEAEGDGVPGTSNSHRLAIHVDLSRIDVVGSENGPHHFGPSGSHQAENAQYLACPEGEANVVKFFMAR